MNHFTDTEHSLLMSRDLIAALFHNSLELYFVLDSEGRFLDTNDRILSFLGHTRGDVTDINIRDILDKEDISRFNDFISHILKYGSVTKSHDFRMKAKSGGVKWGAITGVRLRHDDKSSLIVGTVRDITARKQTEEALRGSDKFFRALFDYSLEIIFMLDLEGRFLDINDRGLSLFGYESEKLLFSHISSVVDHEYQSKAQEIIEHIKQHGYIDAQELRMRTQEGKSIWMDVAGVRIERVGKENTILGIARDISERKVAEKALYESEKRFRTLFDKSLEMFFINDISGRFIDANDRVLSHLGYDRSDILNMRLSDLIDATELDRFHQNIKFIMENGSDTRTHEYQFRTKKGNCIWVELSGARLEQGDAPPGIISIARDITDRKEAEESLRRAEEQLRVSQKMEAVGTLAGGIAHDFNNLLSVIRTNCDLILEYTNKDDETREDVQEIVQATKRATQLTRQLLTFSRKEIPKPEVLSLNGIIADTEKMLRRLITENIELTLQQDDKQEYIVADRGQIEQIIMNLVINARDAMPGGGKLFIETFSIELDEKYTGEQMEVKPGPYVVLSVIDSGCGMEEQTLSHIFEPFYTTKEIGKGTGLGLSTVYGIVKQLGGDISVRSRPGQGTTFRILLPRVKERTQYVTSSIPSSYVRPGTETILVVEDEEMLRRLVCRILRERGYDILEAAHGIEALEKCEMYEKPIHLLLTDIVMPNMGGIELSKYISTLYPGIKVLFMSGYTDYNVALHKLSSSDIHLIRKPFSARDLECELRRILDQTE
jgi:two-component system cell cycle sensor histidine kinase/response regulator CckA